MKPTDTLPRSVSCFFETIASGQHQNNEDLMWRQTGRRFSASRCGRLKNAQNVACFCVEFIPALPFRAECLAVGGSARRCCGAASPIRFYRASRALGEPLRSVQWGSFRFWEALAAGRVAINIDPGRYDATFPAVPANMEVAQTRRLPAHCGLA
jgi:hypothetical protein